MSRQVELSQSLRARLQPLAVLVLVVVWLATPLAWCALRLEELRAAGTATAGQVADLLQREVSTRPALWRYDAWKLGEHARAQMKSPEVRAIVVVDSQSQGVDLQVAGQGPRPQPPGVVWTQSSLRLPGGVRGTVWVAMATDRLARGALALALACGLLGLALAGLLYHVPLQAATRAEVRIRGLVRDLDGLNSTLEARVAEAVARLQQLAVRSAGLQEEERGRVARDLHDGLGQTLTGLRLHMQVLQETGAPGMDDLLRLTDDAIDETRRAVRRLAPPLLAEVGLAETLRRHGQAFAERTGVVVDLLAVDVAVPAMAVACYRIIQESLTNVARHAQASLVTVRLQVVGERLHLLVEDDGVGFTPGSDHAGHGLIGMRERTDLLGGTWHMATAPGEGVRLTVELPLQGG